MKISDLLKYESVIYIDPRVDVEKELCIETSADKLESNSLFFYPKKIGADDYSLPLFDKKAPYAAVVGWDMENTHSDIPLIRVGNVRRTLAMAYSSEFKIDYKKIKVVGITGTNGKTSTANMLFAILRHSGYKVGLISTGIIKINDRVISSERYTMTTPDPSFLYETLSLMQNEGCEFVVMEVSSHALSLEKTAPIPFELGLFTNLSGEHLDFYPDMEEYYKAKLSLFKQCEKGLFNMDDKYSARAYSAAECTKQSIGILNTADVSVCEVELSGLSGSSFYYKEKGLIFKVILSLPGAHNVYNALMALKAAITLGVKPCIAKESLNELKSIDGRMELIKDNITVVIDYAHTPLALENLLKTLNSAKKQKQKLIIVFGCGGNRDRSKRPLMGKIASLGADYIIITEDNNRDEDFEDIARDIISGIEIDRSFVKVSDRKSAITYAILSAKDGDIVAIVGKGHERYKIDKQGYHQFDEREIISSALKERRRRNES